MGRRKNRKMFTLEELKYAAKILNFFAPPPVCVCGSQDFKFGIYKGKFGENELNSICLRCGKHYVYNVKDKKWGTTPIYCTDENFSLYIEG